MLRSPPRRSMSEPTAAADARTNQCARDERKSLDRVVAALTQRFPRASRLTIERIVDRRYLEFYAAPIREYIPVMVEREAREDLRAALGVVQSRRTVGIS
jgi:hypothetical protein